MSFLQAVESAIYLTDSLYPSVNEICGSDLFVPIYVPGAPDLKHLRSQIVCRIVGSITNIRDAVRDGNAAAIPLSELELPPRLYSVAYCERNYRRYGVNRIIKVTGVPMLLLHTYWMGGECVHRAPDFSTQDVFLRNFTEAA